MSRRKNSRRLVIDTCIARSCGCRSCEDPVASSCRTFLWNVRKICHDVVMTSDIKKEWDHNHSRFSRNWMSSMKSKRKIFNSDHQLSARVESRIRHKIRSFRKAERKSIEKDIPFIKAALATDSVIVSCDDKARRLFQELADEMDTLRSIVWVNPTKNSKDVVQWLKRGAQPCEKLKLGFKDD